MSGKNIDALLELWAASVVQYQGHGPFTKTAELYDTIDRTALGGIKWESFQLSYQGDIPDGDIPPWMLATYDVHFRDPRLVANDIIGNPDFDGEIDYGPVRLFDESEHREVKDFMSGDWAWRQGVSRYQLSMSANLTAYFATRTQLRKIRTRMAARSYR